MPRSRIVPSLIAALVAGALLSLAGVASAAPASGHQAAGAVQVADYDLGTVRFPEPGASPKFARIPIRLWGAVGVPAGTGPAPVIVIAHGAHGDGCPGEFAEWPCTAVEQRNDLGFRYLVRALARAGFVVVAPDINAAYSGGWGEPRPGTEQRRFGEIVDATIAALVTASNGGVSPFGVPLAGRVDATRIGLLGHSRGGMNVLRWAADHPAETRSVFLLAPYFDPAATVPDVPTTLVLGTCDKDTGATGAAYLAAARTAGRTQPSWRLVVRGANHNHYNRTLVRLRSDDAGSVTKGRCVRSARPKATGLQTFLTRTATAHFGRTLLGWPPAPWQAPGAAASGPLYGQTVTLSGDRVTP